MQNFDQFWNSLEDKICISFYVMGYDYDSCILEEGLKEELKCACCGDIFKLATEIVPCGHNFCNDCLNRVNQNNSVCPRKLKKITWFFL